MPVIIGNAFWISLFSGILYAIVRLIYIVIRKKKTAVRPQWDREIVLFLFVGYVVALCLLLFSNAHPQNRLFNLVPFRTVREYLSSSQYDNEVFILQRNWDRWRLANLLGNFFLFIPFTVLMPAIWSKCKKFRYNMLVLAMVVVFVEIVQYIIGRSGDIDDVILGLIGGLIGYYGYLIGYRIIHYLQKQTIRSLGSGV